jgi:hypothetical protein
VVVVVANKGDVLLKIISQRVWVYQMLPLTPEMKATIDQNEPPIAAHSGDIDWPILVERELDCRKVPSTIEPSENDTFSFEFVINDDIEVVQVYSYFRNATQKREIGWGLTSVYDLEQETRNKDKANQVVTPAPIKKGARIHGTK